jgi:hypothetical protein
MRRRLAAMLMLGLAVAAHANDDAKASTRVYAFKAFLDGKAIGEHRFTVTVDGASRKVASEAAFVVKILGFTAFRYHHRADEQWTGECLSGLASRTDDDGKPASVRLVRVGDANEITTGTGRRTEPGCLMTYAYWNPAMRERTRLLDPQTGRVDAVKVERVGVGSIAVAGKGVAAIDWRISGGESPIDVWISEQGDWIGLDSMVSKGRHKLTYRLP